MPSTLEVLVPQAAEPGAPEQVVHDVRRLVEHTGATTVRLDFGDVTAVSEIAEQLLRETSRAAEAAGLHVENVDATVVE